MQKMLQCGQPQTEPTYAKNYEIHQQKPKWVGRILSKLSCHNNTRDNWLL